MDVAASRPGTARERLSAIVRANVLGVLRNLDAVHVYLREEHALPSVDDFAERAVRMLLTTD